MPHEGEVKKVAIRKARGSFKHFLKCRLCGAVYRDDNPSATRNFCSPKCLSEAHHYVVPKFLLSKKVFNQVQKEAWEYGVHAEEVVRRIVTEHYRVPDSERRCDEMEKRLRQYEGDLQKIAAKAILAEARTRPPTAKRQAEPIELSEPEPVPDYPAEENISPISAEDEKQFEDSDHVGDIPELNNQSSDEEEELKDNEVE